MIRTVRDLTLILLTLAGALALSQVPRFVQEYQQRLGGALGESMRELEQFHAVAAQTGARFADYLQALEASPDAKVAGTGQAIEALQRRVEALDAAVTRLADASKLTRPLVLVQEYDPDLLRATWSLFSLTASLDLEFGAIGALLGWLLTGVIWGLLGAASPRPVARGR